jgi:predicted transglutaminase-like cysteine proteinase
MTLTTASSINCRAAAFACGLWTLSASPVPAMDLVKQAMIEAATVGQTAKGDVLSEPDRKTIQSKWRNAFGMMAVRTNRINGFERWQGMLQRASRDCGDDCPPGWQGWVEATRDLGGISQFAQLKIINWFVNATLPYRRDIVAFGVADYWASPAEALRLGGDCEDFVALKYLALRQAGFPEEQLRVVVLQDLQRGQPHAVLVAQLDGINYGLDNQLDDLVADTALRRYRPIYSFNGLGKWVHLEVRTREQVAMAN